MSAIKKKTTNKLRHITSRNLRAIQADTRDEENPRLVMSFDENDLEHYLPVTKQVYGRVKDGDGLQHPRLKHGLLRCSKFDFQLVIDKVAPKKGAEPVDTIVGVHLLPSYPYNQCDWEEQLGKRVESDVAIVNIRPDTGEIAVHAFPNRMSSSIPSFVSGLEKIATIDPSTSFTVGDVKYQVIDIYGNEVSFRCTAPKKIR